MKILNTIHNFSNEAKLILAKVGDADYLDLTHEALLEKIADYDILLVGLGLVIDKIAIDSAKKLKVIATATTGLDHVDVAYALEKGIEVISLRGENDFLNTVTGTAELAFGLLLDLVRNISVAYSSVKQYEWDREKFIGHNLSGKTLGVVGYGRLGKMMARYGLAFGMKVLVFDPYIKEVDDNIKKTDFETLLKQSDIISLHVNLSDETEKMFNTAAFAKMKTTAFLVNTSRGKVVDEIDLLTALKNKQLAGYAADVLEGELHFSESFTDYPLVEYAQTHSNCLITPHLGGMTFESREATDLFMAEKIVKWHTKVNK